MEFFKKFLLLSVISIIFNVTLGCSIEASVTGYTEEKLQMGLDNLFPYPVGIIVRNGDVIPISFEDAAQYEETYERLYEILEDMFGSTIFEPIEKGDMFLSSYNVFMEEEVVNVNGNELIEEEIVVQVEYLGKSTSVADSYDFACFMEDETTVMITIPYEDYKALQQGPLAISELSKVAQEEIAPLKFDSSTMIEVVSSIRDEIAYTDGDYSRYQVYDDVEAERVERQLYKKRYNKGKGVNFTAKYNFPPNVSKKSYKGKSNLKKSKYYKPKILKNPKKFPVKRAVKNPNKYVSTKNGTVIY